jgi:hypothetical protein
MRLAALDKRLEVHQEAYTLCLNMKANLAKDGLVDMVQEGQEWWKKNCLYLSADARAAFQLACRRAMEHKEAYDTHDVQYLDDLKAARADFLRAVETIASGVGLPPLHESENGSAE